MCGDLAWFTAILGKVNMSGKWCTWCKLGYSRFLTGPDAVGVEEELWTLAQLKHHKDQIDMDEIGDKPSDIMGVTDEMLINCIPISSFIVPILHTMIGVGNKLLNSFLDWVDVRVEWVPESERNARKEVFAAQKDAVDKQGILADWSNNYGAPLADLRLERLELNQRKRERDENNKFIHSLQERKAMIQESKNLTVQVKEVEKGKKQSLQK